MFIAFFTERKNIADTETLIQLDKDFSLDEIELKARLEDERCKYEIAQDIKQAQSVGVTGVSFLLFDRKHAVFGAGLVEDFLETLTKSFSEWRESNT